VEPRDICGHTLVFPSISRSGAAVMYFTLEVLAMLFLALMVWIIDIQGFQKWTYVFKAFGQNPLVSYALSGLFVKTMLLIKIGDQKLYGWLYTAVFQPVFGDYLGSLMFALSFVMLIWVFAYILDRKGIIVKV
jgi:predicted acyltransferase